MLIYLSRWLYGNEFYWVFLIFAKINYLELPKEAHNSKNII